MHMMNPRCAPPISLRRAAALFALLAAGVMSCSHDTTAPKVSINGFASITAGGSHTCALTPAGVAYCWGGNGEGQLGDSTLVSKSTPTRVAGGHLFTSITAGFTHTCALTAAGAAYCWGSAGHVGDGTTTRHNVPTPVAGGATFASITTGAEGGQSCGVSTSGLALCWGSAAPDVIPGGLAFTSIALGAFHTCALTKSGAAYCWGADNGQLGIGTPDTTVVPGPVAVHGGLTFSSLVAGYLFTCGVTTGHIAYCWGDNTSGDLGDGTGTERDVPTAVQGGLAFRAVSGAGNNHACGLTSAGLAYCWGDDDYGDLGDGNGLLNEPIIERDSPVAVSGGLMYQSLASGPYHNCAITAAGAAYCWGNNGQGELGIGTKISSNIPVAVTMP